MLHFQNFVEYLRSGMFHNLLGQASMKPQTLVFLLQATELAHELSYLGNRFSLMPPLVVFVKSSSHFVQKISDNSEISVSEIIK